MWTGNFDHRISSDLIELVWQIVHDQAELRPTAVEARREMKKRVAKQAKFTV